MESNGLLRRQARHNLFLFILDITILMISRRTVKPPMKQILSKIRTHTVENITFLMMQLG